MRHIFLWNATMWFERLLDCHCWNAQYSLEILKGRVLCFKGTEIEMLIDYLSNKVGQNYIFCKYLTSSSFIVKREQSTSRRLAKSVTWLKLSVDFNNYQFISINFWVQSFECLAILIFCSLFLRIFINRHKSSFRLIIISLV